MSSKIKYTKELLEPIVKSSLTFSDVCRQLGVKPLTGNQWHITKKIRTYGIDTSHMLGQAHLKGKVFPSKQLIEKYLSNELPISSHNLRKKLIKEGLKESKCEDCGLTEWMGKIIPLELDHIDGDHFNNKLDNLRILCPNCHALTNNYSGKNSTHILIDKPVLTCNNCGGIKKTKESKICSTCYSQIRLINKNIQE